MSSSADAWRLWAASSEPYGSGRKAGVGALLDEDLLGRLKRYKRQVAKRYRVIEPEIAERALPAEPLFVSPKLDGELWFLVKKDGDLALVAFNGRVLHGISCLRGVAERLASVSQAVIAGELVASVSSERPRSHHVQTALSDSKLEASLSFHAFDLVEDEGQDALGRSYEQRHARLVALLGEDAGAARCGVVLTQRGDGALVAARFREWVGSDRFEGVVARSDRGLTYKIKPTTSLDLVVIAFGERITGEVKQVRELQVGLVREDGTFQLVGSVGTGLSEDDRTHWHARLSAIEAPSSFRLANREGTLCRFVRPEIVVEVRVSDFLSSDGWDVPIRRMSLAHDAGGWRAVGETRTAVLLHPVLLRERTDKSVDPGSVGLTQITAHLEGETEEAVKATRRASAEIVRRGVFAKESKGQVAVRKYVVVRTHKEHEGTHPPFVVFFTDWSAGRKEPLQTALRTASSSALADEHVTAWVLENVKKGWAELVAQRVGPAAIAEIALPEAAMLGTGEAAVPGAGETAAEKPAKKPRAPRKKKAESSEDAG